MGNICVYTYIRYIYVYIYEICQYFDNGLKWNDIPSAPACAVRGMQENQDGWEQNSISQELMKRIINTI
jgi:hypothetical protein